MKQPSKLQALSAEFKDLWPEYYDDPRYSLMYFGFEVGEGWADLLRELFTEFRAIGGIELAQVKEKYGTLRVYYHWRQGHTVTGEMDDAAETALERAERRSAITCEVCGEPGVLRGAGWLMTRCDAHAAGQVPYSELDQF
jgi:hypothetical protein